MIGSGNVYHHLSYVEDLAEGIVLAGEKDEAIRSKLLQSAVKNILH